MCIFLVGALGFKAVINGFYGIGVQQGYAPKQPIAFSHKIHAGQYEIDCKYCHIGAAKGKNATIPSVNICMNCHNQIKTGTITGEKEIAMIVSACENNKPIEWVRIHNLPILPISIMLNTLTSVVLNVKPVMDRLKPWMLFVSTLY